MWSALVVCLLLLCAPHARAQTPEMRRDNIFAGAVEIGTAYQNAPDKCVFFEEVICDEIDLPDAVCNQALIDCPNNCQVHGEQCAETFNFLAKQVSLLLYEFNTDLVEGAKQVKADDDLDQFIEILGFWILTRDLEAVYSLAKLFVEFQPPSVFPPNTDTIDEFVDKLDEATDTANDEYDDLDVLDQIQQAINQMPDDPEFRDGFEEVLELLEPLLGPIRAMLPANSTVLAAVNAKMAEQCDTGAALRFFDGQPEQEIAAARIFSRVHVAEIDLSAQMDHCAIPDEFGPLEAAQITFCASDLVLGACGAGDECESLIFDGVSPSEQSCAIDDSECEASSPGNSCVCNESLCFFTSGVEVFTARCVDETAEQVYDRLSQVVEQIGPLTLSERDGDRAWVLCSSDDLLAAADNIYCRNAFGALLSHTLANATSVKSYSKLHVEVANFELGVLPPLSTEPPTPAPTTAPTEAPTVARVGDSSVLVTVAIATLAVIVCIITLSLLAFNTQ